MSVTYYIQDKGSRNCEKVYKNKLLYKYLLQKMGLKFELESYLYLLFQIVKEVLLIIMSERLEMKCDCFVPLLTSDHCYVYVVKEDRLRYLLHQCYN